MMSRRRVVAAILGFGVPLAAVGLLIVNASVDLTDEPDLRADADELRETVRRLRTIRPELANLDVSALRSSESTTQLQARCYSDSGGAGQPWLERIWKVRRNGARHAASEVAAALIGDGWQGDPTPDQFGSYHFTRAFDGWTAQLDVGESSDVDRDGPVEVYVDARVADANPCYVVDTG